MTQPPLTRRERNEASDEPPRPAQPVISEAPRFWPAPQVAAPEAMSGRIGWDSARPSLESVSGRIRPLQTTGGVLPELEDSPENRRRPLWRHPALLVSAATTLLAVIAFVVLLMLGVFGATPAASDLALETTDNAVRATWSGPDVPYQVIVVDGPAGDAIDVSQRVTGTQLWLPLSVKLIDQDSCLIVRPAEGNEKADPSMDRAALDAQGAVAGCVSDAPAKE